MLDRIRASLPSLAPAEQRVAKLVLLDPRSFALMPVSELADRAHELLGPSPPRHWAAHPTLPRHRQRKRQDGVGAGPAEQPGRDGQRPA